MDRAINALLAKQAITEAIYRYARGLDRMDKDIAYSVFHEDCTAVYHDDIYEGSGHGFVDWVWESHAKMSHHSHQMSNPLIELEDSDDPQTAGSETYVTVSLITLPDDDGTQIHLGAKSRYNDRWSKRNGIWAIERREHVLDMQFVDGAVVAGGKESRRDPNDPSYRFVGGL